MSDVPTPERGQQNLGETDTTPDHPEWQQDEDDDFGVSDEDEGYEDTDPDEDDDEGFDDA